MPERKKRRRHRGDGALFQRADGMWIGQVDLGWLNGKRRRPTVSARTQREARNKLDELKKTLAETGGAVPEKTLTVEQWLNYWVEEIVAPNTRPKTAQFYRTLCKNHIIPSIGKRRIDSLQTEHIRAMHKAILAKEYRGKPVSSTTVGHCHQTLTTALNAAKKEGKIARNVAELVEPPGRSGKQRNGLTATEARTLLSKTIDSGRSARWMTALLTGARQGECLGLQWDRVDLVGGVLDLSWQLQRIRWTHGCTKPCGKTRGGSCPNRKLDAPADYELQQLHGGLCLVRPKSKSGTRVVPIAAPLLSSLRKRHLEYLAEKDGYTVDHGLVFCTVKGEPLDPRDDSKSWHDDCEASGVPSVELHAARHTTATLLLEAGIDVKVVEQIVGHSSAATTRGYQYVSIELARKAVAALVDEINRELPAAAED